VKGDDDPGGQLRRTTRKIARVGGGSLPDRDLGLHTAGCGVASMACCFHQMLHGVAIQTPSSGRYVIDRTLRDPAPEVIAVVDDVTTTGAHFIATRNMLRREFPDTKIVGLFIARRVPEAVDTRGF
jgi:hypothetical protein